MGHEELSCRRGSTALCDTFVWQQGSTTASRMSEPSASSHCSSLGMLPSAGTCTCVSPAPIALSKSALHHQQVTTKHPVSLCLLLSPPAAKLVSSAYTVTATYDTTCPFSKSSTLCRYSIIIYSSSVAAHRPMRGIATATHMARNCCCCVSALLLFSPLFF